MRCINGHKTKCVDTRERKDGQIRRRYKCYLCTDMFTTLETKNIMRKKVRQGHGASLTISPNTMTTPRKITPEDQPIFPCWLWGSVGNHWRRFERWRVNYTPQQGLWTHWLPDQPDAPTEIPTIPRTRCGEYRM